MKKVVLNDDAENVIVNVARHPQNGDTNGVSNAVKTRHIRIELKPQKQAANGFPTFLKFSFPIDGRSWTRD